MILEFQYNLMNSTSTYLISNKIPFNKVEIEYKCSKIIQLPVPKKMYEKRIEEVNVYESLINGHLDYLFMSKLSVYSIDQLGY